MREVLVVGVSTRAAADSAARAGYRVTALDAFGDLDQSDGVRALSMPRDFGTAFTVQAAARAAASIECDTIAYVSPFENYPQAVARLSRSRLLLGNPPDVLRRVRDPLLLAAALERRNVPALRCHTDALSFRAQPGIVDLPVEGPPYRDDSDSSPSARNDTASYRSGAWLLKPYRSGGGHGVHSWSPGAPIPRGYYVQEHVDGIPGSIVFAAAGGRAVALGLTTQIVGDPKFGASGFRYCGNILVPAGDPVFARAPQLTESAFTLMRVVSEQCGLVGVNGIDFVARDGTAYPVEVNPRYSASMELVERASHDVSIFAVHAESCVSGTLPSFDLERARRDARATAKAIVFARHDVVCGDTRAWLDDPTVRDVPHPGERIRTGQPVCTVFAEGADTATCYAALVHRATGIYDALESWATVAV